MKYPVKQLSLFSLVLLLLCVSLSCLQISSAQKFAGPLVLTGSTPADPEVRKLLGIPLETVVDSVRWKLSLARGEKTSNPFSLDLVYGESKPNTRDFLVDNKLSLSGDYTVSRKAEGKTARETYRLDTGKVSISLAKLNEDIFHLLSAENKLMVGDSGYSYTLNRRSASESAAASLPVPAAAIPENEIQAAFNGRTPCAELSQQYGIKVPAGCFKLKWGITFNRDPKTFAPSTFTMRRIDHRPYDIQGKWAIEKGSGANAGAVIYKLTPDDKTIQPMALAAGDENVLFFLDKNGRTFVGNEEFSYTINRKSN